MPQFKIAAYNVSGVWSQRSIMAVEAMFYLVINNMAVHLVSVEPELGNKVLLDRFWEQNHLGQPNKKTADCFAPVFLNLSNITLYNSTENTFNISLLITKKNHFAAIIPFSPFLLWHCANILYTLWPSKWAFRGYGEGLLLRETLYIIAEAKTSPWRMSS